MSKKLLIKKERSKDDDARIHWSSMVSQAKLWFNCQRRIQAAHIDNNEYQYCRAIDNLIDSMFKVDRVNVLRYKKAIYNIRKELTTMEKYRLVYSYTVDLLEPYLKQLFIPDDKGNLYEEGEEEAI